jgi:hypothetical protein
MWAAASRRCKEAGNGRPRAKEQIARIGCARLSWALAPSPFLIFYVPDYWAADIGVAAGAQQKQPHASRQQVQTGKQLEYIPGGYPPAARVDVGAMRA